MFRKDMYQPKRILAVLTCVIFILSLWPAPVWAKGGGFSGGRSFSSFGGGRSFSTNFSRVAPVPSSGSSNTKGSSGGRSFFTPRPSSPPSLQQDYTTGRKSFVSPRTSFTTRQPSYTGTWDRSTAGTNDKYPEKPQVRVYGSPPHPPYYYHNYYWSLPWYYHLFFTPDHYYTPWGYHYYAPRFLTWILLFILLAVGFMFLSRVSPFL